MKNGKEAKLECQILSNERGSFLYADTMNRENLCLAKKALKNGLAAIGKASWYCKLPHGHRLPPGLCKLADDELVDAISALEEARRLLNQRPRRERGCAGVNSEPVKLGDCCWGLLKIIKARMDKHDAK